MSSELAVTVLRGAALFVVAVAALQAVVLLAWYCSAHAIAPTRLWHVVSVSIGWLLCQVFFAIALVRTFVVSDAIPPPGIRAGLCMAGEAFVMAGAHLLFLSALRRSRRSRER